ncbi:MAG: alpha/beta hydrolase family protein [Woeseiaceae bacterium]
MNMLSSKLAAAIRGRIAVAAGLMIFCVSTASAYDKTFVERIDGSQVKLVVDRPEGLSNIPIVLFVDGSGCASVERERFQKYARLPGEFGQKAAKVFVDKSGVTAVDDYRDCSESYIEYDSVDQRVFDHLRAIQHLRKHATWWNREILLFGWSDGGTIGAAVTAYTPEVKKAVFGGMGGGIPMTAQFEDYVICTPDRTEDRDACIAELRKMYDEIRENPSPSKTWFGDFNTYKAWATRLDAVEYNLIKDIDVPLLIIHGELDRDNVPVQATRELVRLLNEAGDVDFEYWEVPGMDHGTRSLGEERGDLVRIAMLNWLLDQPVGIGGPPLFGESSDE